MPAGFSSRHQVPQHLVGGGPSRVRRHMHCGLTVASAPEDRNGTAKIADFAGSREMMRTRVRVWPLVFTKLQGGREAV